MKKSQPERNNRLNELECPEVFGAIEMRMACD